MAVSGLAKAAISSGITTCALLLLRLTPYYAPHIYFPYFCQAQIWLPNLLQKCLAALRPFFGLHFITGHQTYRSIEDESEYWTQSERTQKQLFGFDSRAQEILTPRGERRIVYYTPRLLPEYREPHPRDIDSKDFLPSTKSLVKWHWLTFPDRIHPTILQASKRLKRFSQRDLREIFRISRLVRSDDIKKDTRNESTLSPHMKRSSTKPRRHHQPRGGEHKSMWERWLEAKGPDVVVCFEDTSN